MGGAHSILPVPAAMIDRLSTALDNLALTMANDIIVLQQLTALNLALATLVTMLSAANKKLVEALAKANVVSPPAAMPGTPGAARSTNSLFSCNYCWTHGHRCSQYHTSATCGNKAAGHRARMGGSDTKKGRNTCTCRCGMADLVYCYNSNLCKNNYYSAIATEYILNPPTIPTHHTGIADSGASRICIRRPCCQIQSPCSNCQSLRGQLSPRILGGQRHLCIGILSPSSSNVGACHAYLPPYLIGLGPFANQGCNIIFTKTSITVYHPDGHPILSGWQDETGPHLWCFPQNPQPQDASNATVLQPPIPAPSPLPTPTSDGMPLPLQPQWLTRRPWWL